MMIRKSIIISALVSFACSSALFADSWTYTRFNIRNMNIERQHGLLSVSMDIDPAKYDMGIEKQMILQPVVKSKEGNDSTVFPCIILAGRNSYFSTERKGDFGGVLLRAGSGNSFHYTAAVDWQPWMEESGLALRSRVEIGRAS